MNPRYVIGLISLSLWLPRWAACQGSPSPTITTNQPDSVKLWTLRHIGDSLSSIQQLSQAKQFYQQSLVQAKPTGQPNLIGLGYRAVGYWHEQVSDYPQAIGYYQQAMTEFQKTGNPRYLTRTMNFISYCYAQLNNNKQAQSYAEASLKLARQAKLDDIIVGCYSQLARLAAVRKDNKQVDWYTDQELNYYAKQKDWSSYYVSLYNAGLRDKNRGKYEQAEQRFRQVELYATKQHDKYLLGYAQTSMPYALIPQNKLDSAH